MTNGSIKYFSQLAKWGLRMIENYCNQLVWLTVGKLLLMWVINAISSNSLNSSSMGPDHVKSVARNSNWLILASSRLFCASQQLLEDCGLQWAADYSGLCTLIPWEGLEWLFYQLLLLPSAGMTSEIYLCLKSSNACLPPPMKWVAIEPRDWHYSKL